MKIIMVLVSVLLLTACGQKNKDAISVYKACVKAEMKPYEERNALGNVEIRCGIPGRASGLL